MKTRIVYAGLAVAYYLSWVWFALFGVVLNLVSLPLLLWPRGGGAGAWVRAAIGRLFRLWLAWFHFSRVLRITWRGFEAPLTRGTLYIANHPTLLDATFLLARLPDTICIFKPSLRRSPAIGVAAIAADYVTGESGVDLIRETAERVAAGRSLLIFPEGTRTQPGTTLGALRPGFALIAQRARAPVQLIVIRASPDLVPRGRPWWKPPAVLPARADLALDRRWEHDPNRPTALLTAEVARRLSEVLAAPQ
jgi:1-acyl-sn-glycerol-3-phosphate acyltransferase